MELIHGSITIYRSPAHVPARPPDRRQCSTITVITITTVSITTSTTIITSTISIAVITIIAIITIIIILTLKRGSLDKDFNTTGTPQL